MRPFKRAIKVIRYRFRMGRLFNSAYYKKNNDDVTLPTLFCFYHFYTIGRKELRRPSADFDAEFYLNAHPDVKEVGVNPLDHFLSHGRKEGRLGVDPQHSKSPVGIRKRFKKIRIPMKKRGNQYQRWFWQNFPAKKDLQFQREYSFAHQPLISILVPVYNPSLKVFTEMIRSVEAQTYANWELCLSDSSTDENLFAPIEKLVSGRSNIRYVKHASRKGISENSNAALALAQGEFIGLLDQDDLLCADALFEMVSRINVNSNVDILYSDEDKISENSKELFQPHFKPDWSPDTFMSLMYTCHFTVYRKAVITEMGGFRKAFDGAQDYDLMLRASEGNRTIAHVPRVLYHWRVSDTSIAGGIDAKNYAVDALKAAKKEALKRRGLQGRLREVPEFPGQFCVDYDVQGTPLVSIIIPTKDKLDILKQCIESILTHTAYSNYEIIVVDNESEEKETKEYLKQLVSQKTIRVVLFNEKFNFSKMNNQAVVGSKGEYLLFLNNDTEVYQGDWLEKMLGMAQLDHVGAVGAQLLYPGKSAIQHCGLVNLKRGPGHAFLNCSAAQIHYFGRNKLDYNWIGVTAACLMISRKKFTELQGFDEELSIAYNDVDLCFRLVEAGYYNVCCNSVQLVHHESVSRGVDHLDAKKNERLEKERALLYSKNPLYVEYDPFFNRNLHDDRIDFACKEVD